MSKIVLETEARNKLAKVWTNENFGKLPFGEAAALLRNQQAVSLALRNHLIQTAMDLEIYNVLSSERWQKLMDILDPESPSYDPEVMFSAFETGMLYLHR